MVEIRNFQWGIKRGKKPKWNPNHLYNKKYKMGFIAILKPQVLSQKLIFSPLKSSKSYKTKKVYLSCHSQKCTD